MTLTKICGLTTAETVDAAVAGGAAFVGFNFYPPSPRHIAPAAARPLADRARRRARVVAVTVNPDDQALDEIMRALAPDLIQLHGAEPPQRGAEIRARTGAGLIRALGVSTAEDLAAAQAWDGLADHLMFDARPPKGAALPGGMGLSFDWTILAGRRFARPWFLAGGLDPWNVAEAVSRSRAPMVDVSSGVERGAGLKDPALIGAFLEAVRRT
jgi:phosphoribosylanthranilate isomerase